MSWRDDSSSSDAKGAGSSRNSDGSQKSGGSSGGQGGQGGGAKGAKKSGLSPGFTGIRNLGLTTGNVTGSSAYGPAGGNAVGMGAPGFENPEATARTLARMRQVTPAPRPASAPPQQVAPPPPEPVVAPPVTYPGYLGPNSPLAQASLPQVGGTVPATVQQGINFTTQGPTSMPGSSVGPQIGGVTTVNGVGGDRGSWVTPGRQPNQPQSNPNAGQVGGGSGGGGGGGWGDDAPTGLKDPAGFDTRDPVSRGIGMAIVGEKAPSGLQVKNSQNYKLNRDDVMNGLASTSADTVGDLRSRPLSTIGSRLAPTNPAPAAQTRNLSPNGIFGPRATPENPITANAPRALEDSLYGWSLAPKMPKDTERISQAENAVIGKWYGAPKEETVHTDWNWNGLGQMDKTGQTVTPRTKPNSVFGNTLGPETPNPASYRTPAGGLMRNLGRQR